MTNKVCIVTGAGKGIGFQVVKDFLLDNNIVYACTKSSTTNINSLKESLPERFSRNLFIELFDINDHKISKDVIQKVWKRNNKIDILVNCAGIAHGALLSMSKMSDMEKVFKTNFFSIIHFIQLCSRFMAKRQEGSICNISSISSFRNDPGSLIYGSSKCALNFATKVIAQELGDSNIRINSVAPGVTLTEMLHQMDDKLIEKQRQSSALKKIATTTEISSIIQFLCSSSASHITGQIIKVDGGQL